MKMDDLRGTLRGDQLANRAADFHRKGDFAAAEGLYLQALDAQPDHFDALHSLGFLRYQQGRFTEALSSIGAALKASPDFPPALVNYALVLQALNRPAEALARYDSVLAIKPDALEALCSRGNALRDYYRGPLLRDLNYNAYDKALSVPPRAPDILTYRGLALRDLNRLAEALASFERALAIQPDHVEALNNRRNLLQGLDRPAEALASRDSPAMRDPTSRQSPGGLGVRGTYRSDPPAAVQQPSNHEKHEMALAVARAFEPKRVVGFDKIRLGRDFDGGYVLIDDFAGVGAALSCGISDDATWDLAIAKRNIPVHQFDHTIEKGPIDHPLLTFHKQRVAAADAPGTLCLDSMAEQFLRGCERAILKIDIEGDEWQAFSTVSAATLGKFSQIACEFHGLYYAAHPMWNKRFVAVLSKLRALFEVVHVHGNNAGPFANIANVILPCVLEITLASRSCYQFAESNEVFPTALDQPNLPSQPEMRLGCFRF
jgi:Tfp pilus assembly protein PilF